MQSRASPEIVTGHRSPTGPSLLVSAGLAWLVIAGGCAVVLGEYEVRDTGPSGTAGSSGGSSAVQCSGNEQCVESPWTECVGGWCRQPCLDKDDCYYYWTVCSNGTCSLHIGEPCGSDEQCGGLDCISVDNRNAPVASYCTDYCSHSWECPRDTECIGSQCRLIGEGGPLCYSYVQGPCADCIVESCEWDLQDCCGYSSPCAAVHEAIAQCDATRTYDDCNVFYYTSAGYDAPSDLLECAYGACEGACWNPCPGEDC